jgi:hypothetical protein
MSQDMPVIWMALKVRLPRTASAVRIVVPNARPAQGNEKRWPASRVAQRTLSLE